VNGWRTGIPEHVLEQRGEDEGAVGLFVRMRNEP
jgi:hypothetical protein